MQDSRNPMPADGSTTRSSDLGNNLGADLGNTNLGPDARTKCGVVLIGHGNTASALLEAARAILTPELIGDGLADIIALDAGVGQTPELRAKICAAVEKVDEGRGILLLTDLMGSSPCMCGINESAGHGIAVVSGLNLAMLTKLANSDRRSSPHEIAEACADSTRRSICVKTF
jgi:PTS system mannose-specific IIA component